MQHEHKVSYRYTHVTYDILTNTQLTVSSLWCRSHNNSKPKLKLKRKRKRCENICHKIQMYLIEWKRSSKRFVLNTQSNVYAVTGAWDSISPLQTAHTNPPFSTTYFPLLGSGQDEACGKRIKVKVDDAENFCCLFCGLY